MNRYRLALRIIPLLLIALSGIAVADDPKARAIMEKVDARDDGDNLTAHMQMRLINRHGKQRVRTLRTFGKEKGEDRLNLMFFTAPADVDGVGFLTWDYDDNQQDDDQWLYLPALRKTKRIAGSDKTSSFMGSDVSYADMTKPSLDDYDYRLVKESKVGENPVWVIESLPRSPEVVEKMGYTKSLALVRKDNHFVVRSVSWIDGSPDLKYMDVKRLEQIDGIWVATEVHTTTKRGKQTRHKTIITLSDVKFDQSLSEDWFSVRQLEKGL